MYPNISKILETIGSNQPVTLTAKCSTAITRHLIRAVTLDDSQYISFPTLKSEFGVKDLILLMDNRVVLKMNSIIGAILDNYNNQTLFNDPKYHTLLKESGYELCARLITHPHKYLPTKTFSLILGFANPSDTQKPFLDIILFKLDGSKEILDFAVNAYLACDGFSTTCDLFLDNDFDEYCSKYKTTNIHSILTNKHTQVKSPNWQDYQEAVYQLLLPYTKNNEHYPIWELLDKVYGFDVPSNEERENKLPSYDLLHDGKVKWDFKQSLNGHDSLNKFREGLQNNLFTVKNINVQKTDSVFQAVIITCDFVPNTNSCLTQKCIQALTNLTFWDKLTDEEKQKYEYLFIPQTVKMVIAIGIGKYGKQTIPYLSKSNVVYKLFNTNKFATINYDVEDLFITDTIWNKQNPIAISYNETNQVCDDNHQVEQDIMEVKRLMILHKNPTFAEKTNVYNIVQLLSGMNDMDFGTSGHPEVLIEVEGKSIHYVNFKTNLLKLEHCDLSKNEWDIRYAIHAITNNGNTYHQKTIYVKLLNPSDKMKDTVNLLSSLIA